MNENSTMILPSESSKVELETSGGRHASSSAGTFALRRANYFTETAKPQLTSEEQWELIELIREGDVDAKRRMIAHNMHLVVGFAKRNANRGLALLDLVREGTQGLIHALEQYEPKGDFDFSSYATWHISHNIESAIMNRNNLRHSFQTVSAPEGSFDNAAHHQWGV